MTTFKKGDVVLYSPSDLTGTPRFGAIVASEPRVIGGTLTCRLEGLNKTYKRGQTIVPEAIVDRLCLAPTELVSGQWLLGSDDFEPDGGITYCQTPTPDTGHIGWIWWAKGKQGDAENYEAARAAVEERCR